MSNFNNDVIIFSSYESDAKVTASMEGITPVKNDDPSGACGCVPNSSENLKFTRTLNDDGSATFTFFLNVFNHTQSLLNDFINKMLLVTEKDTVFLHCPAFIGMDTSEFIASAIQLCKSKNIVISAPYIMCTEAAYLLTFASKIISSKCAFMRIGLPIVLAYGKVSDADNALACNKYRILEMLKALKQKGFIATEEEFIHIVKHQGSISLFGEKLNAVIARINNQQ